MADLLKYGIDNTVIDGFDYSEQYPVLGSLKHMVDKIEKLGSCHYKVILKPSWCYGDSGHKYIVRNWDLFSSFNKISSCSCIECMKSGELTKKNRGIYL